MARTFNGSTDNILLNPGGCAFTGDISIAAICQRTTAVPNAAIMDAVGTGFWEFDVSGSTSGVANKLEFATQSGNTTAATLTLVTADGWCLIAVTKATGTTTPRFHKYVFSTGTWTHENGSGTVPDNSGSNTTVDLGNSGGDAWKGDIDCVGVWNANLSDAQIENLPFTLQAWFQVAPKALWLLDQSATGQKVMDLSGGGAGENTLTGTSIASSSVPVFNTTDGIWLPTLPPGAAAPQAVPRPVLTHTVSVQGRRDMGRRFPPPSLEPSGTRTTGSGSQTLGGFERAIGPEPPQLILPLPGQRQQTIQTSLVAVSGRRNVPRRFPLQNLEPSGTKTTGSGSQTLGAFERPLGPEPPQLVLPLPPLRAQTVRVTLAGRTRTEVSRRAPHSKLFPPAVIRSLPNLRQQTIQTSLAAVRARRVQPLRFPLQGYHGAEARTSSQVAGTIVFPARIVGPQPPQLIIPLPSLKAQTISTTLARTPRQAFRTRPFRTRPGLSVPFAPIKTTTRGAARARYELGRRAAHSHLSPPAIVTTTPPPVTTAPLRALMGVGT